MTSAMGPGVRREHEQRVLTALRDNGARSRAELGELVGLSRSSLSEVTTSLLDRGVIIVLDKDAAPRRGAGRPAERLALDPSSGQYIGLDFQHARVDVVVADATHEILGAGTSPYELESPWHERMQVAFNLIDGVAEKANAHFGALAWIYAGVPGQCPAPGVADGYGRADVVSCLTAGVVSTVTARTAWTSRLGQLTNRLSSLGQPARSA
jgi:DNA-binding Lrp family transcriptional regulator